MSRMVQTLFEDFLVCIKLLLLFPQDYDSLKEIYKEYLGKNINIKEGVKLIRFYIKVSLHAFCVILSNRDFNIEILYVLVVHRVLWKGKSMKSGKGVTCMGRLQWKFPLHPLQSKFLQSWFLNPLLCFLLFPLHWFELQMEQ